VIGLFDAAGTNQIGTSGSLVDSSPIAGDIFGYRDRAEAGGTTNVSFDNFSLQTIPEPSALVLMAPAAALLARRRKRAL